MLVGQCQADQAPRFAGHEVDGLSVAALGGDQQVAFVLPILVVNQQHHLALAVVLEEFFDRVESHAARSL
ncbi:hypothetical protein D3C76_1598420 [compost metagenome]